jgi:thiamine pyrophosphate-dependent acetolactate synthase large subunit-like protein
LLSNLGALATIGRYSLRNLCCVVLDNEMFQITGGQPTHTAYGTELAAIARGCGIASSQTVDSLEAFCDAFQQMLATPGPHVLVAKVDGHQSAGYQPRKGILIKYRFMQSIGLAPDVDALAWS